MKDKGKELWVAEFQLNNLQEIAENSNNPTNRKEYFIIIPGQDPKVETLVEKKYPQHKISLVRTELLASTRDKNLTFKIEKLVSVWI